MDEHEAMLAIQKELDGVEWTPETLDRIAEIMRKAAYRIRDRNDRDPEPKIKHVPLPVFADRVRARREEKQIGFYEAKDKFAAKIAFQPSAACEGRRRRSGRLRADRAFGPSNRGDGK
jgi:hypothetical protein